MKPVIYQLVVRYFGNTKGTNVVDGDFEQNGYYNRWWMAPGLSDWLYPFARYQPGSGELAIVVANFRPSAPESGKIRLPRELFRACGLPSEAVVSIRLALNEGGAAGSPAHPYTLDELATAGFDATVSTQACNVYLLEPA